MDEGGIWKRSVSLCVSSVRGTWRRAPLLGTLKDVRLRLWKQASVSNAAPFWGTWRECFFPRDSERRVRFFYQENFY